VPTNEKSGGEGGIRTLGTGVSPYNGLARGSFSPPSLVFKGLQSDSGPPSRVQSLSFGSYCAPLCAPDLAAVQTRGFVHQYPLANHLSPFGFGEVTFRTFQFSVLG
jgi:hypothetical protein